MMALVLVVPFITIIYYPSIFLINFIETVFTMYDYYWYQNDKLNKTIYLLERLLMLGTYNAVILLQSPSAYLILIPLLAGLVLILKLILFYIAYQDLGRPLIIPVDT